jgi:hypothetical protein
LFRAGQGMDGSGLSGREEFCDLQEIMVTQGKHGGHDGLLRQVQCHIQTSVKHLDDTRNTSMDVLVITGVFEALLQSFAPTATTPSFVTFRWLMTGWILSTRRRYDTKLIVDRLVGKDAVIVLAGDVALCHERISRSRFR